MAVLIPSIGSCSHRMTNGERRLAQRLEKKLDDDYLLWYDVPVGPEQVFPDFIVLHPRRGLLILEVKDWRLETIHKASRYHWEIMPTGSVKVVKNPLTQARHYATQVVNALQRDPQLVQGAGPHQGKLAFPWGYGVVLTRITRRQFEAAGLGQAIPSDQVICADEMLESVDEETFQQSLWGMFHHGFGSVMTVPQIDRVRWILFPEIRVAVQEDLFQETDRGNAELPDIMRVMDLQQEQLARSLGAGHRVIHGVAGSGKTMILGYRAEYLARAELSEKPILVLCYNRPLATGLTAHFESRGLSAKVHVRSFHSWCWQQLTAYGQALPPNGPGKFDELVRRVIRGVERGQIPSGQYQAVLIDEGHDFQPEWLKLVVQMVDPETDSLLLLYDDAQSIYQRRAARRFSFKSLGIQAQGRTTILRVNYRNTRQILGLASQVAGDLLAGEDSADDGIPVVHPVSCGRDGERPLVIRLPNLNAELAKVAELMEEAHEGGYAWGDMAVLCPDHATMTACAHAFKRRGLPCRVRRRAGDYQPGADHVKIMTVHVSKGLEFPVVALPGVAKLIELEEDEAEAARLFYVASTRATQRLLVTVSGDGAFAERLAGA